MTASCFISCILSIVDGYTNQTKLVAQAGLVTMLMILTRWVLSVLMMSHAL